MKPCIISKADVYSGFPDRVQELEAKAFTKAKKKLKETQHVIFAVEYCGALILIKGTSYGYDSNKLCRVYVDSHHSVQFLKDLPEFTSSMEFTAINLPGYYVFNIHKKFLLRAK